MKATRFLLGALLLLLCGTVLQAQPSLVPKPAQATWGKGKFTIQPQTTIAYGDKALQPAADYLCLLYTSPSPRDRTRSRMPSSA